LRSCIIWAADGVDDGVDVFACDTILYAEFALACPPAAIPEDIVPALIGLRTHAISIRIYTFHVAMLRRYR
jgi:hypothetical protein